MALDRCGARRFATVNDVRLRKVVASILCALPLLATLASCLEATQILIDVRTDVSCTTLRGTGVIAAEPGRVERAAATTVSRQCEGRGIIGTLVLTPRTSKDADVAIKVVAGVDVDVSECTAERNYKGCIVQRRELGYVEHTGLELPIDLLLVCLDVPCDEQSTCAADGRCVSAKITSGSDCRPPRRCYPPGDPANNTGGLGEDASADGSNADGSDEDALLFSDAPSDSTSSSDAMPDAKDAHSDAPIDAPSDTGTDAKDSSTQDAPFDAPADAAIDGPMVSDGAAVDAL